jgi:putative hydrolase of the HAD superfamily
MRACITPVPGVSVSLDAVIFDYGGVLCLPQPPGDRARLEAIARVEPARFWEAYWGLREPYDRGSLDGAGYWAAVGGALGRRFSAGEVARLVAADAASWSHADEAMVAWASALRRAGLRTALLSNMPREIRDHVVGELDWLRAFDCASFSCDIGAVKPEPEIYRHCLERLGVPADRALFVDDRAENVAAARRAGLHGVVFSSAGRLAADLRGRFALPPLVARP